jgi:hypothetical protein
LTANIRCYRVSHNEMSISRSEPCQE